MESNFKRTFYFRVYDRLHNKVYEPVLNEQKQVVEFITMSQFGELILHSRTHAKEGWQNAMVTKQKVVADDGSKPTNRFIIDHPNDRLPNYTKKNFSLYVAPVKWKFSEDDDDGVYFEDLIEMQDENK
jgi:hypothetical protein